MGYPIPQPLNQLKVLRGPQTKAKRIISRLNVQKWDELHFNAFQKLHTKTNFYIILTIMFLLKA